MKTNKPSTINYRTQYRLMRLSLHLMPLMPTAIINRLSAALVARMDEAEANPQHFHIDRYDMVVDWGCTVHYAYERKAAQ